MFELHYLRVIGRKLRRALKFSPMHKVLRGLKNHGIELGGLHALELFAFTGEYHTKDYSHYVASIEAWEIEHEYENTLRRNIPTAKVKITDSYKEIKTTLGKFNFILIDNPSSTYGPTNGHYCEHFDLFPDVFRVAMDSTVMIISVIPQTTPAALRRFPYLFNDEQLSRRKEFYKTNHPEKVSFEEMVKTYSDILRVNGFDLEWHFIVHRSFAYYLVLKIKRLTK